MAQEVGYYQDNVTFTEGPFVVVPLPFGGEWRIESEQKGMGHPVLPDKTIYFIMEELGLHGRTHDKKQAKRVCDILNQMVLFRKIILDGHVWVARDS